MSELPKVKTIDFVAGRHYQSPQGEPFKVIETDDAYFVLSDQEQKLKHDWYSEVFEFIQRTDLDKAITVQQDLKELLK